VLLVSASCVCLLLRKYSVKQSQPHATDLKETMNQYKSIRSKLILASKGAAMGVADIIPGVSGGTIAFISGIYEHLILAINSVKFSHALNFFTLLIFCWHKEKREKSLQSLAQIHWSFLLPLFSGVILAVLCMARIIPYLMIHYPFYMYSLFFGLIVFSIPIIFRKMSQNLKSFLLLGVFAVVMFTLMGYSQNFEGSTFLPYVFISGAIAICAMILPGISGSYILVLMGQYLIVLEALRNRDVSILLVFITGIVIGILSFARLLKYLLKNYYSATMASLTGIMVGSLRAIWPGHFAPDTGASGAEITLAITIALLGGSIIYLMNAFSRSIGDPEPPVK